MQRVSEIRGLPASVTVDNGPGFAGRFACRSRQEQASESRRILSARRRAHFGGVETGCAALNQALRRAPAWARDAGAIDRADADVDRVGGRAGCLVVGTSARAGEATVVRR